MSPTEKISEPDPPCRHPEHLPPSHMVFPPGTWKHTCPACGKVTVFKVPQIYLGASHD